jgi:hypothetical protein
MEIQLNVEEGDITIGFGLEPLIAESDLIQAIRSLLNH